MRKLVWVCLLVCLVVLLTGCGEKSGDPASPAPASSDAPGRNAVKVDVDLIHVSSTIAQAQITDMTQNNPESYLGKVILADGRYYNQISERLNLEHHYLLIGDEIECCAQLVEFFLKDGVYPDSYPDLDSGFSVQGVWEKRETQYGTFYGISTDVVVCP